MKKTILFLFLFSIGLFGSLEAIASGGYTHTHTTPTLELKPISIDNSYQTAAVCFLGVGDCQQGGYNKGDDDMDTDGAKQCQNAGFTRKTCNAVQDPIKNCEHDKNFVTECKCKTNLVTCTSPKFGVGLACGGKYASCQCPATVSMSYPNDRCTKTCDGNCITKTCTKSSNESGCRYGTQSCSDGCGGNTRSCCRPCSPASNETGCSYGTQSCSDGCGGTRQCCKTVPPCNSSHPSWCRPCRTCHGDCCSDGTFKSCDTRCGGSGCYTPPPAPPPPPPPPPAPDSNACKDTYVIGTSRTGWCDFNGSNRPYQYIWCRKERRCTTYGGSTKYNIAESYFMANLIPYSTQAECQRALGSGDNCGEGRIY